MEHFLSQHTIAELRGKSQDELIAIIDTQVHFMMLQGFMDNFKKEKPELYKKLLDSLAKTFNANT